MQFNVFVCQMSQLHQKSLCCCVWNKTFTGVHTHPKQPPCGLFLSFLFSVKKKYRKEKKKMVLLSRTIQKFSVEIKKLQQCDSCLWIKTVWSHWEQFVKDCFKKMVLICVWVLALLATWFSFNLVYMQSVWNAMFYTVCCGFLFSSPFFLSRLHPHFSSHLRHVSHCVQQEKKRGKK